MPDNNFSRAAALDMPDADLLETAADQAIASCGDDARESVKPLIVGNRFLESELEKLRAAASAGYARGKLVPQDQRQRPFTAVIAAREADR